MKQKDFIKQENAKRERERLVEYYELLLYLNGSVIEKKVVNRFNAYKAEFERLNAVCKANSNYKLEVRLYDYEKNFQKRIY